MNTFEPRLFTWLKSIYTCANSHYGLDKGNEGHDCTLRNLITGGSDSKHSMSYISQEKCISAVDEDKIALKFAFRGEYLK